MSVKAQAIQVQMQIDRVCEDIERQKDSEVLKNLERTKISLLRELNAVRDPIARLPLELSSEIFVQCFFRDGRGGMPGMLNIPMLLLNVCNAWTDIALSTPTLWASISLYLPRGEGFEELLRRWFERAGTHLLQVDVTGTLDSSVAAVIWDRSSHLQHLHLYPEYGYMDVHRQLLGGTQPGSLPVLQALTIFGQQLDSKFFRLPILQLLRISPNLAELNVDGVRLVDTEDEQAVEFEEFSLPNLRHLSLLSTMILGVDAVAEYNELTTHILLASISAPQLQTLTISLNTDDASVVSFLQRSSPPLQKLFIMDCINFDTLNKVLAHAPTLTQLEIKCQDVYGSAEIWCSKLAHVLASVLPNLETLRVRGLTRFSASVWDRILYALTTHRAQIRAIRLVFNYYDASSEPIPPSHILAAFRELSADGMDVWVGSHAGQYVVPA